MANSDKHQVTTDWLAITANGAEVVNGDVNIFNLLHVKIDFKISDTSPATQDIGDFYMSNASDSIRVTLLTGEKLFAKVSQSTTLVGVVSS